MDYNDQKTWKLFAEGKTKGIFQLESGLGKAWSKKLAPNNIEELSALIAIIRPGCISGDTMITVSTYNHSDGRMRYHRVSMRKFFLNKHKYEKILSIDENNLSLINNTTIDSFYSGDKECFKVKIRKYSLKHSKSTNHHPDWYNLECTDDHRLLTSDMQWIELKDLKVGTRIACIKRKSQFGTKKDSVANRFVKNGPQHINAIGSKYFSEICFQAYHEKCVMCNFNEVTLDTHHIDGNRYEDNSINNLVFLCPNCHRKEQHKIINKEDIIKNRSNYVLPKSNDVEWVIYLGKESVGIKDTYDISMQAPNHNFIAGNFIVHNCLKAFVDGKSMTQHYVDRKHGREEVTYLHPALEEVLKPTYGVLVYQEQSMRIAQKIAGFDLQEADVLRKAIGKKKADLMNEVKKSFIEGAQRVGTVTKEEAEEIFGWIEKSSRYAFNKSHSISYAVCSYWSAYNKAHYTKEFFLSYLYHANEKQDPHQEIYELISEAKIFDIEAKTPNIKNYKAKFNIENNKIFFGIKDIKTLTGKTGDKVIECINTIEKELDKKITEFSWMEILVFLSTLIGSTGFKALASIGFFTELKCNITRNKALYDYEIFKGLTQAEITWIKNNINNKKWTNLIECLKDLAPTKKEGGGTSKTERKQTILNEIQLLSNPPYDLSDDASWVIDQETKFFGCPITLTKVEASDTSAANTTCKQIVNGKKGKNICIVANIQRLSDYTIKKGESQGQLMSFLAIEDETCLLDGVIIFPKVREKYKYILYEGNNLIFCGSINGNDTSFIVDQIYEI